MTNLTTTPTTIQEINAKLTEYFNSEEYKKEEDRLVEEIVWNHFMIGRCESTDEMIKFYKKDLKKINTFDELNVLFDNNLEDENNEWIEKYFLKDKADNGKDYYDIYECNDWYVLYTYDEVHFIDWNTVEDYENDKVEMTQEEIESFVL